MNAVFVDYANQIDNMQRCKAPGNVKTKCYEFKDWTQEQIISSQLYFELNMSWLILPDSE
jgi:hypothetical protein